MSETETNKQAILDFVQAVWRDGDLARLPDFWTEGCINHAQPGPDNVGLGALRAYHAQFGAAFSAFSDVQISVVQQVAEADRVVTHVLTSAKQTGEFFGIARTGRSVTLMTIRIDRLEAGKVAEHWSVADMAGLMQQLQG